MGGGIGSILYSERAQIDGGVEYFHFNAVGHTVATSTVDGTVKSSNLYEAYGSIVLSTGSSQNNRLANTKERNYSIALDNHGRRYFDTEIGRYISPDPAGYPNGLNNYLYTNNNPICRIDPLGLGWWNTVSGLLRVVGGAAETLAGVSLAVASSWTGIGAIAGGTVALHGLDQLVAGCRQLWSGEREDSLTSMAMQAAGLSKDTANIVDAGISIVGSLGAGMFTAASKVAAAAATPEAAGMSTAQVLSAIDKGSKALPTAKYLELGGETTSALSKAAQMSSGAVKGTDGIHILKAVTLTGTGLTPSADIAAGVIGAGGAGGSVAVDSALTGERPGLTKTESKIDARTKLLEQVDRITERRSAPPGEQSLTAPGRDRKRYQSTSSTPESGTSQEKLPVLIVRPEGKSKK